MKGIVNDEAEPILDEGHRLRHLRRAGSFFNESVRNGPIVGIGPGFNRALELFAERERQRALPGVWTGSNSHRPNNGAYVDPNYYIVEW